MWSALNSNNCLHIWRFATTKGLYETCMHVLMPNRHIMMTIPVNRDGSECEAAGVHGEVDKEVDHFAHEGAEHPVLQGVDGGLERDAEDDEEEVGHAQVEYEQIGGVVSQLAAPQKHSQHQAVADGAQQEDEGEDHRHNHTGGVQLIAFGKIRLPSWLTEILKVRHFGSLKLGKRESVCVKQLLIIVVKLWPVLLSPA